MKTKFIVTALAILLAANILMMFVYPFGVHAEGFKNKKGTMGRTKRVDGFKNMKRRQQGFQTYVAASAGGAGGSYQAMGAYDNVSIPTGNSSAWRYKTPNEPLMGPAFEPGPDSLFLFKNNQCKPECCGSSFSCDGGCVCTSPEQRQYIASRGGNRTAPEDSA